MKEAIALLLIALIVVQGFSVLFVYASLTPASFSAALKPGESTVETETVFLPGEIPAADVMFAFDLTGSMSGAIATAKSNALSIMNTLDTLISDAQYGVISFMDYPHSYTSYGYTASYGSGPDYAYLLDEPITSNRGSVSSAINALTIGSGDDSPQDYTRIMYESYADPGIGWRPGAKRILILLCDDVPHDENLNEGVTTGIWSTGGDPGRDEIMFTGDDLDLQTVLAGMASNNVVLLVARYGGSYALNYWQYWAGLTAGSVYVSSIASDIPSAIVSLVGGVAAHVNKLTLKVETGYEAWLTSVTPSDYTNIDIPPSGITKVFDVTITVPLGTSPGTYTFDMTADADGASYGEQTITITCIGGPVDNEPPVIWNVRHEPLYPTFYDTISFYANVTDNVAVAKVQLNYTLDGGATWLLKDMPLLAGDAYSTSLGPFSQFQIIGFYVIAYDTSGNVAYGSEIVPPLPEPPKIAPIVVSDQPSNPLPNGNDIAYDVIDTGTEIIANMSELGIYGNGLTYAIIYSLDGGITWMQAGMTNVEGFIWSYVIPSFTNILFKIVASDGNSSRVYWIIVGPWKYPIYLYFSTNEKYYPVPGLDFDYTQTGDYDITNNKQSYDTYFSDYKPGDLDQDGIPDAPAYTYLKPKSVDDGCLVIEYWLYYAFNDYGPDKHEHDFESVYLWIDLSTGNIKKLACSQHLWVNHYLFDVKSPPSRINLAVEEGGHGMAMLADYDHDGMPDLNIWGTYLLARTSSDNQIPWFLAPGDSGLPLSYAGINPRSFVAQLYPFVIYDPRIPLNKLHLFSDPATLTTGLALSAIFPLLPDTVDEIPKYYSGLSALLGRATVLKTSYGFQLSVSSDTKFTFAVMAPLFRQEFGDPGKFWSKLSWGWWTLKQIVKYVFVPFVLPEILGYFGIAGSLGIVARGATSIALRIFFDPVQGSIFDSKGHVLDCSSGTNDLPGGIMFANRNMTDGLYDLAVVFTNSSADYVYQVKGTEPTAAYNFTVSLVDAHGNGRSFNATNVPIHAGEVHRYIINWTLLELDGLGVEVDVDRNGDGVFESKLLSDSELAADEFKLPPIAIFTEDAHTVSVGTPITFDPSASYDPDGTIVLYEWDWESDGVYDLSTTSPTVVSHAYTVEGTYQVTLRVTDNDSLTNMTTAIKIITTPQLVVPEVPVGTVLASASMIVALLVYLAMPRWKRKRQQSHNSAELM